MAIILLEMVEGEAEKAGIARVTSVKVRVGASSGVVPDALGFAFEAAKDDTMASSAKLLIDEIPARGFCRECSKDFSTFPFRYTCPVCFGLDIEIRETGDELTLMSIEGE